MQRLVNPLSKKLDITDMECVKLDTAVIHVDPSDVHVLPLAKRCPLGHPMAGRIAALFAPLARTWVRCADHSNAQEIANC